MATADDRFDRLEKMLLAGFQTQRADLDAEIGTRFQEMRAELRSELATDSRAEFQEMRAELRSELATDSRAEFQKMRAELRSELATDSRAEFQKMRLELRSEMRTGFETINKRLDSLSTGFATLHRDFAGRTDILAHYTHLTDKGYFTMADRLITLEQRMERMENTILRPQGQL